MDNRFFVDPNDSLRHRALDSRKHNAEKFAHQPSMPRDGGVFVVSRIAILKFLSVARWCPRGATLPYPYPEKLIECYFVAATLGALLIRLESKDIEVTRQESDDD